MSVWQKSILNADATLREAAENLEKTGLRIALIVSNEHNLLGTLTDSDLRRSLLNRTPMDACVLDVMNPNPIFGEETWPKRRALALMAKHKILQMPILNGDGRVVGLIGNNRILELHKFENPVFLMAGGLGTRLRPLTNDCPKPMLQIGGKPILEHILQNFVEAGFYRFYISTHYMPEVVENHFGDGSDWGVHIKYLYEREQLGTGGALGLLPKSEVSLPIFVMNGDLMTSVDLQSLLEFHEQNGGAATICVREYEYQIPFGVVTNDGVKVNSFNEKPVHQCLINAGIYILNPEVIVNMCPDEKIDMPTLLEHCMDKIGPVTMFPIHEDWIDIGQMHEFREASRQFVD